MMLVTHRFLIVAGWHTVGSERLRTRIRGNSRLS
jgi:hypothetical protein